MSPEIKTAYISAIIFTVAIVMVSFGPWLVGLTGKTVLAFLGGLSVGIIWTFTIFYSGVKKEYLMLEEHIKKFKESQSRVCFYCGHYFEEHSSTRCWPPTWSCAGDEGSCECNKFMDLGEILE